MTQLDLITSLPTRLSCEILQDWVDVKTITVLDSAYCHKALREQFLQLIQSDELILHHSLCEKQEYMMKWLNLRNLHSRTAYLWSDVSIEFVEEYLVKCGSCVREVKLAAHNSNNIFRAVANHCHQLTHCWAHNIYLYSPDFRSILERNPSLTELYITPGPRTSPKHRPPHNTFFDGIELRNLRLLSVLHTDLPNFCLSILRMVKNVVQLELSVPNYRSSYCTESELRQIPQLCPHLRSLALKKISINRHNEESDDEVHANSDQHVLAEEIASCRGLVNLCVENVFITNAEILHIVRNLKDLRSLDIRNCTALTSESLVHIYTHCADTLTTLQLSMPINGPAFEHAALDALLARCTALRVFHLVQNACGLYLHHRPAYVLPPAISQLSALLLQDHAVTDDNLLYIAKYCPHLEVLGMLCHSFDETPYTSQGLKAIILKCFSLREVEIDARMHNCPYSGAPHMVVEQAYCLWRELRPRLSIYRDCSVLDKYELLKLPV